MRTPFFSIIIPTLNEEKFLPNLLVSLAGQTKKNFEVIVVDGSSTDKTVCRAKEFKKKLPSLHVVISKKRSLPLQRNIGAGEAKGDWLVFVDADSICMPYFLSRISDHVTHEMITAFTTWVLPDSNVINDAIFTLFANVFLEGTLLFKRPLTPGPLTGIRKDVFTRVGGYDESHAFNEDMEFGLRLAKQGFAITLIREGLYVWSMRRIRREGKMKVMQQYVVSALPIIFLKRPFKYMPGYVMGGHLYHKKKQIRRSVLRMYEQKLKKLLTELFD